MSVLQPRKVQGYGWRPDTPDPRDRIFNNEHKVFRGVHLPGEFDLTSGFPPPYDQDRLGSCTGNGWAGIDEYMAIHQGEASDTPSRLFIYYQERVYEGSVNSDSGAEIRSGAKVLAEVGAPSESLWGYDINKFADKPPQQAYDDAKKHEALVYQRVILGGPHAPVRSAIVQGFPIVFGMPVPDYFEGGWDPASQALPLPGADANFIGGHCMVVTGYDFTLHRFHVPVFKVRNSWGTGWGENGYCYLDYRWFAVDNSLATDLWVIEKVM